jgi:hypothetical protein
MYSRPRRRNATAALLVDQDERRLQFDRHDNSLGFTGVKLPAKFGELYTIFGSDHAHPVGLYLDSMPTQFRGHPRWQYNFAKQAPQKLQAANNR